MAENKEEKKSEVLSKDQVEKINKLLSSLSDEQLEGVKNRLSDLKKSLKENDAAEENGDDVMEIAAPSPALINVIPTFSRPVMPSQIAPIQLKGNFEKLITEIADTQSKCFALFSIDEKYESKGTISKNQFPKTGTLVRLLHAKSIPGEVHFVCEGICRVEIEKWVKFGSELKAKIRYPENIMPEQGSEDELKLKAYAMNLVALLQEILPLNPMYSDEMRQYLLRFDQNDPSMLADCAASITSTTQSILQDILETYDVLTKLEKSQSILKKELKAAKLQDAIRSSVNERLTKRQKEFVLKEQIKEIQKELGTRGDAFSEGDEFISRMKKLNPPAEIKRRFDNEIKKFNTIDTNSPEYGIARNYLETLCTIPWGQYAKENLNLEHAREVRMKIMKA